MTGVKKHENSNDEIKQKVKSIVEDWKKAIEASGKAKSSKPAAAALETITKQIKISTASTSSPPSTPHSSSQSAPLKERTIKDDGVTIRSTGNPVRDNCIGMLYAAIGLGSTEGMAL